MLKRKKSEIEELEAFIVANRRLPFRCIGCVFNIKNMSCELVNVFTDDKESLLNNPKLKDCPVVIEKCNK